MEMIDKQKIRLHNFEYLMKILDEAEGERDTEIGAFSFLWENSYIRKVVVTPSMKTSIAGLKTFLATEVLEIFGANSKSKVSYKNICAYLSGDLSKKYSFSFDVLDEIFDIEKNKDLLLKECCVLPKEPDMSEEIQQAEKLFPYIFMNRLRNVVWKKLRNFFKLCDQDVCSGCNKKNEIYFQFIQAVALYEIFLIEFIQEQGSAYAEESMILMKEIEEELDILKAKGHALKEYSTGQRKEILSIMQDICSDVNALNDIQIEKLSNLVTYVNVFQLLMADFGISFNAMCYLLMVFEAMNVCSTSMRGIKKLSLKIMNELSEVYEKDLEILQKYNKNRMSRYKKVNEKLEELLEKYREEDYDETIVIADFMEELCKSPKARNQELLRELERKLGRPIYRDLGGK